MDNVKVSIIIPVHNTDSALLMNCLESALSQTYKNTEVVLVDNNSNKENISIYKKNHVYNDERIIHVSENKKGASFARKKGLFESSGEYIVFLDSDDCLKHEHVERLLDEAKRKDLDIVFSGRERIEGNNKKIITPILINDTVNAMEYEKAFVVGGEKNYLTGTLFKKRVLEKIKFKNIKYGEDIDYVYNAIISSKRVAAISDVLYTYVINKHGVTQDRGYEAARQHYDDAVQIYDIYKKNNPEMIDEINVARLKKFIESLDYIRKNNKGDYHNYRKFIKEYRDCREKCKIRKIIKSNNNIYNKTMLITINFGCVFCSYLINSMKHMYRNRKVGIR